MCILSLAVPIVHSHVLSLQFVLCTLGQGQRSHYQKGAYLDLHVEGYHQEGSQRIQRIMYATG